MRNKNKTQEVTERKYKSLLRALICARQRATHLINSDNNRNLSGLGQSDVLPPHLNDPTSN